MFPQGEYLEIQSSETIPVLQLKMSAALASYNRYNWSWDVLDFCFERLWALGSLLAFACLTFAWWFRVRGLVLHLLRSLHL